MWVLLLLFSFQSFCTLIANISVYFLQRLISFCNKLYLTRADMLRSISPGLELETHVSRSNVYFSMASVIFFRILNVTNNKFSGCMYGLLASHPGRKDKNR